jgi:transposase
LTEAKGIPVAEELTGANRHARKKLADRLDGTVIAPAPAVPPHLALDRGDAYPACRDAALAHGSAAHIPPKASEATPLPPPGHPDPHPPRRWVVEVAPGWVNRFRRRLTLTEKQARHYRGFVHLAAVRIISRKLRHARSLSG